MGACGYGPEMPSTIFTIDGETRPLTERVAVGGAAGHNLWSGTATTGLAAQGVRQTAGAGSHYTGAAGGGQDSM